MWLPLNIALTHLRTRKRQSLVSVLGVAMGVGFFIAMAALMQGFHVYFVSKVIDVWPHVVIKDEYRSAPLQPAQRLFSDGVVMLRGLKPRDELRGIKNADTVISDLNRRTDLTAAPTLRAQVFLRYGSKDVSATLVGIEPEQERRVSHLENDLIAGNLNALHTAANGIILGDGVAKKVGATLNDTLSVTSPAGVVLKMKVVGIFRTGITPIDNFESYALLKKAQILQDRPNVINQIRIRLNDVSQTRSIATSIEARLGYRTESWEETYENILSIFVIQNGIMYSTVGAILIVAAFGIFNIISTVVHEKTRDIGILKSIGFEERDIRRIFLIEGLLVGLVGTLLGWALGYGLTRLLGAIRIHNEGFITAEGFILHYTIIHYLIAGSFALLSATFAAWLPARKAAHLNPVDIIRGAA
ncbi:MAG: ABC transporter permease [Gammaproteobacteria bacterium]|nr:ABC transporter permease [Gammaproteobacteria bacterium]